MNAENLSKEIRLHETMDGVVWAQDFMEHFGDRKQEIDLDLMIAWFSNSIMVGYDLGLKKRQLNEGQRSYQSFAQQMDEKQKHSVTLLNQKTK